MRAGNGAGGKTEGRKSGKKERIKERGLAGIADTFHGFKRESLKYERNLKPTMILVLIKTQSCV